YAGAHDARRGGTWGARQCGSGHAGALPCEADPEELAMRVTRRQGELLDRGASDIAFLSSIEDIVEDARNGRIVILVDDQDRENEGDLYIPAQMATPEAINFMARYGRGLICLALTRERVEQLGLPLMAREN